MKTEQTQLADQILIMDAQDGRTGAMDQLVRRWQKRLWHHAFRLTGDSEAAWDITQQAWLGIIRGLRKLNDPAHFRGWAYRITTHKAVNWIHKRSREKAVPLEAIQEPVQPTVMEFGLQEMLRKLDLKKRLVIMLYYFEELTIPEISTALQVPAGTIKSRLHSGRNELKQMLQKETE